MKYEVELPPDVDQQLSAKASECGQDIVHLIRLAVLQFVERDVPTTVLNGHWSEDADARRRELIDKEIAGTIAAAERTELARLDRLANEHFDRVAPPPIEGARRLHEHFLRRRASQE